MSRLDHILVIPNLLSAIQSVEHLRAGRGVSIHKAVVIHLDWSKTHIMRIRLALVKALCDFVDDDAIANSLRQIIGQIEELIKLLRKGDKSPLLPGNYRPISLPSVFYKLASAAIIGELKLFSKGLLVKNKKPT